MTMDGRYIGIAGANANGCMDGRYIGIAGANASGCMDGLYTGIASLAPYKVHPCTTSGRVQCQWLPGGDVSILKFVYGTSMCHYSR